MSTEELDPLPLLLRRYQLRAAMRHEKRRGYVLTLRDDTAANSRPTATFSGHSLEECVAFASAAYADDDPARPR